MADIVDAATRSRMMSGIRAKNTKPELIVKKALRAQGFRFALKSTTLPGRPDVVLPRWRVAIFVHGCFWHHHGCHLSKMPTNNRLFWQEKLSRNQDRDTQALIVLVSMGWRVATIWECATRGASAKAALDDVTTTLTRWIREMPSDMTFETPTASNGNLR